MGKLKKGDRIRLKVRTVFGFKGTATVVNDQVNNLVQWRPDGSNPDDTSQDFCYACRHEVAKITKGYGNP